VRERWGVGPWGALAILLAFALAGMSVLKISRPIMHYLLPADTPKWLWWTVRILVIVPIYEVLLLSYGTILGKREFFWSKQKRTLRFLSWPLRKLARPFVLIARRSRRR
jgi:hypothetical protein